MSPYALIVEGFRTQESRERLLPVRKRNPKRLLHLRLVQHGIRRPPRRSRVLVRRARIHGAAPVRDKPAFHALSENLLGKVEPGDFSQIGHMVDSVRNALAASPLLDDFQNHARESDAVRRGAFLVVHDFHRIVRVHRPNHRIDEVLSAPTVKPCSAEDVEIVRFLGDCLLALGLCHAVNAKRFYRSILGDWRRLISVKNIISRDMKERNAEFLCKTRDVPRTVRIQGARLFSFAFGLVHCCVGRAVHDERDFFASGKSFKCRIIEDRHVAVGAKKVNPVFRKGAADFRAEHPVATDDPDFHFLSP